MKLKTNTILLAIAAFLIAGGAVFWEVRQSNRDQNNAELNQRGDLFDFKEDDVVRLSVTPSQGTTLVFERTTESFPNTWKMIKPKQVVADEAAIAFLLDQLASSKTQNTVTVEKAQWEDFGIAPDNPQAQVTLDNGTTHQLLLASETFDKKHLYALVDVPQPLPDSVQVSIVPTTLIDAIKRPLDEWEYDPKDLPSVPTSQPPISPQQQPSLPTNREQQIETKPANPKSEEPVEEP